MEFDTEFGRFPKESRWDCNQPLATEIKRLIISNFCVSLHSFFCHFCKHRHLAINIIINHYFFFVGMISVQSSSILSKAPCQDIGIVRNRVSKRLSSKPSLIASDSDNNFFFMLWRGFELKFDCYTLFRILSTNHHVNIFTKLL